MRFHSGSYTQQPHAETPTAVKAAAASVLSELLSNPYHTLTEAVHRDNLEVLHELSSHQLSKAVAR